jgi:endonuclease YncB( thermonuclease family)
VGHLSPGDGGGRTEPVPEMLDESRRHTGWQLAVMTTAVLTACAGQQAPASSPRMVTVEGVVSGNVIRLGDGSSIRLRGIDAPRGTECHALVSKRLLAQLLPPGTRVRLGAGYVFKGRLNVNLALVRRGAATAYSVRPSSRYTEALLRAAQRARSARRGAWGACDATLDPLHSWRLERRSPDRIVRKG